MIGGVNVVNAGFDVIKLQRPVINIDACRDHPWHRAETDLGAIRHIAGVKRQGAREHFGVKLISLAVKVNKGPRIGGR